MTDTLHGFELLRDQSIPELNTRARLYRHMRTGAELLSLSNDDENKVFGITFRTPPSDSTGIAHILEHSVLCGSRKYPVKEPFVELLKGSLKTFLNAFTYPDKTCYPVASQNLQDFYNLIDVYLDAVFYPRLTPFILQQEGWHYEIDTPDAPLQYKGVVFNEMKGAYSSPDGVLSEQSQQSIFPDTTYGLDSGGDPEKIPDLTFEQFIAFHREHYHPSNARIFFYGNDDPEERLRLVNEYLKGFDRLTVENKVQLQPRFEAPRRLVCPFASGGDGQGAKAMVTVNWLLGEATDVELNLSFQILHYALLGMPGSPLRKALIDSGLGEDLAGVGLENELRQMYFSTGLKGIDAHNADRVEALILETLEGIVVNGLDRNTIEAALNTIEFRLRENNSGGYPQGLMLMLRSLITWLHDSAPLALVAFEGPLEAVKARLAAHPRYFEELIQSAFLTNPHRATVILEPDPELAERRKVGERARLEAVKRSLSGDAIETLIENTRMLHDKQEAPDSPEALATLPMLKLSDLDRHNKVIPLEVLTHETTRVLYHDLFTNGIVYLDVGFDLHTLPQAYLPFVPLFGRALTEMGTEREDYVTLGKRISAKTGGMRAEFYTATPKGGDAATAWLFFRSKSMSRQAGDLLGILEEVLLSMKLDDQERFRQMVHQEKARQEQRLVPSGHQLVNLRIRSHFTEADWAAEVMGGISYLLFLRELARTVDEDWTGVLNTLEEMRRLLVNRSSMIVNVTLDREGWSQFEPQLAKLLAALPTATPVPVAWSPEHPPAFEGLTIPAQVNYVGKGANLYALGYRYHGSTNVISGYLRTSWLWDRIRVQGGAYGAFCHFDRLSGNFVFVSYRDPNLIKTVENFDGTADFLRATPLTHDELTKAIIGTIGTIDSYLLPDMKGYISMMRTLTGDTEEERQRMRQEVLSTSAADFRSFADFLDRLRQEGIVKVLGSPDSVKDAAEAHPQWLHTMRVL